MLTASGVSLLWAFPEKCARVHVCIFIHTHAYSRHLLTYEIDEFTPVSFIPTQDQSSLWTVPLHFYSEKLASNILLFPTGPTLAHKQPSCLPPLLL